MADESILTDKIKAFIGKMEEPVLLRVEDGSIQRFAEAVADPNPLYNDVDYAKNSKHGALVAPPSFIGWPIKPQTGMSMGVIGDLLMAGAPKNLLDAGVTFEYLGVIKSGDILLAVNKLDKIEEKVQKSGARMLVATSVRSYTNQNGKLVLKESHDLIMR